MKILLIKPKILSFVAGVLNAMLFMLSVALELQFSMFICGACMMLNFALMGLQIYKEGHFRGRR